MATDIQLKCFKCSQVTSFSGGVGFRDDCEHCGEDVHVCLNCRFYDPGAYNECKESSAEVVRDKERANFCEYFQSGSGAGGQQKKDELLAAAESLFKKKS